MKLRYSPNSPYVRKVLVLAHEIGIAGRIELVPTVVGATSTGLEAASDNPLVKIPVLMLSGGLTLYDSPVIAEYLDTLHDGQRLFPADGEGRWVALRRQALADGLLDAALLVRQELTLRPEALRWQDWIDGQMRKIRQAVVAMEAEVGGFADSPAIGEIAVAVALGYLDFRFPQENWRAGHPGLAGFYARFSERPSMQATRPPAP